MMGAAPHRAFGPVSIRIPLVAVLAAGFAFPAAAAGQDPASPVTVSTVVYSSAPTRAGEMALRMDLYRVAGARVKGVVVLAHGGGFTSAHREIEENRVYGEALARRGYLAAAISYRLLGDAPLVDGWGSAYADAVRSLRIPRLVAAIQQLGPDFPDAVAAAAVDLVASVDWLRRNARELGFEPERVAVFGASAGAISGLTAAYAMEAYGAANLDVAAVIDLRGMLLRADGAGNPFEDGDPPLMILHGEDDRSVPLSYAEEVFALAKEGGTPVELYTVEGVGHELGGTGLLTLRLDSTRTVLDRVDAFLESAFAGTPDRRSIRGRLLPPLGPCGSRATSCR